MALEIQKKNIKHSFFISLIAFISTAYLNGMQLDDNKKMMNDMLLEAAQKGDYLQAVTALEKGADPDGYVERDSYATPLYHAARNGHDILVRLLIAKKANIELGQRMSQGDNESPLVVAAKHGHLGCVSALLKAGASTWSWGESILKITFHQHHDIPITRLLVQYGVADTLVIEANKGFYKPSDAIIAACFTDPLENAAIRDSYGETLMLLKEIEDGVLQRNPNSSWITLLISYPSAVRYKSEENKRLSNALMCAAGQGYVEIVKLLLDFKAIPFDAFEIVQNIVVSRECVGVPPNYIEIKKVLTACANQHLEKMHAIMSSIKNNRAFFIHQLPPELMTLLFLFLRGRVEVKRTI